MFTGIVQACVPVEKLEKKKGLWSFGIEVSGNTLQGLRFGTSIAIDGVCLTVTRIEGHVVYFDTMMETLSRTTLCELEVGKKVNIERSARMGDEVGGHTVSGHVSGIAKIVQIEEPENNKIVTFQCDKKFMKFIFEKGYIALDGVSLTLCNPNFEENTFQVYFIPETLSRTMFGEKQIGDSVNMEVDSQTQAIVETVERVMAQKGLN
ncbi:riboflavin synthase subunit alpha [Candidatus Nomurabacteria bacterium]|nr:riboflavin synthase subunit alpha [Candidatus Nomurabacteria bacterium]